MTPPGPHPTIVRDGLVITSSDYWGGPWEKAHIPFMSNHLGVLQILCPYQPYRNMFEASISEPLIISRGIFPCGCDAIELFFGPPRHQSFYVMAEQTNRLPGDPAGKRPWEVEFWFKVDDYMGMLVRYTALWRHEPLPCMVPISWKAPQPWEHKPRKEKRAGITMFHLQRAYKKGSRPNRDREIKPPHHSSWRWEEEFKGKHPAAWRWGG